MLAVKLADWLDATGAALTPKLALAAPAATVTFAGMVTTALFVANFTACPPDGAAPFKVTEHIEGPGVTTVAGEHEKPVNERAAGCFTEIVPPVPVAEAPVPERSTVLAVTCTGKLVAVVPDAELNIAVAIAPSAIVMALIPDTRHVVEPVAFVHEIVLPALDAAVFTTALTPTISVDEYVIVHSTPAGVGPPLALNVRAKLACPPGEMVAEPRETIAC